MWTRRPTFEPKTTSIGGDGGRTLPRAYETSAENVFRKRDPRITRPVQNRSPTCFYDITPVDSDSPENARETPKSTCGRALHWYVLTETRTGTDRTGPTRFNKDQGRTGPNWYVLMDFYRFNRVTWFTDKWLSTIHELFLFPDDSRRFDA